MTGSIHFHRRPGLLMVILILGLTACTSLAMPSSATPPPITTAVSPTNTITPTTGPTVTPTLRVDQVNLIATVWESDPIVPILTYHRFKNDNPDDVSDNMKMKYSDFRAQLQALYDAGYSLVPLEPWLKGDLSASPGRIPLVFTLDDLYFADQLFLNEDGTPSNRSGLGILWEFYQEHPDFGYSAALFYNLGDKLYANHATTTWFIETAGWEQALAKVIVWGIEHDLMPYNHFYTHPVLSKLDGPSMLNQYQRNEKRMTQLLTIAGRPELFDQLGNMIALTYGQWPGTHYMNDFLVGMPSLTRKPLLAVFEIDFASRPKYMPAPYTGEFDRYHLPRIVANANALELLVENKDQFPVAGQCTLGYVDIALAQDADTLMELIRSAHHAGDCPVGVYAVNGMLFRVQYGVISEIVIPQP